MAKFEIGQQVYVKTTGESGVVLEEITVDTGDGTSIVGYGVRVPAVDEKGRIQHGKAQEFKAFELETFEEKVKREVENIVIEQKIRAVAKEEFDEWQDSREDKVVTMAVQ